MPETPSMPVPRRELILGGQKSGKSRQALTRVRAWLDGAGQRRAVLIATAEPGDDEMRARIERHRQERAQQLPELHTVEAGRHLAQALGTHSRPDTLVLVDCLTLWLTQWLMPPPPQQPPAPGAHEPVIDEWLLALDQATGPVLMVSNDIGGGVVPLGPEVRAFVDAAGALHQRVAQRCQRVTWMVAGLPLAVKDQA